MVGDLISWRMDEKVAIPSKWLSDVETVHGEDRRLMA
jgi:hypothetical protein